MKTLTEKWFDYIIKEWFWYCPHSYFEEEKFNSVGRYDGDYESKLNEEFEKYYEDKKKYVRMYQEFEEKFGNYYEKIEIKDYNQELEEYQERVEYYAEKLIDTLSWYVEVGVINIDELVLEKLKNCDLRLLLLGYIQNEDIDLEEIPKIYNSANVFLSDYHEYEKNLIENNVVPKELSLSFHDCNIIDVIKKENNLTLVIEWSYDTIYYLTFENIYEKHIKEKELLFEIHSNWFYYEDNKYYYYIENLYSELYQFTCDNITIVEKK